MTSYQQRTLARAQARIRADIEQGIVPPTVRSFEQLHDFVDANEYLLDDAGEFDAELEGLSVEEITREVMGPVIDTLSAWLREGRHKSNGAWRVDEPFVPTHRYVVRYPDGSRGRYDVKMADGVPVDRTNWTWGRPGEPLEFPEGARVRLYPLGERKPNGAFLIHLADGTTLRGTTVKVIERMSMEPWAKGHREDAQAAFPVDAARLAALLPGATAAGHSVYVRRGSDLVRIVSVTDGRKHNGGHSAKTVDLIVSGRGAARTLTLQVWDDAGELVESNSGRLDHIWPGFDLGRAHHDAAAQSAVYDHDLHAGDSITLYVAPKGGSPQVMRSWAVDAERTPVAAANAARKHNGAAPPLPYDQRLRAWETAWAAYQASDQGNDAWEALEFACRFIGERNPIPPPLAFLWHRRPAGPARGPCPICGCGDARMRAEHRRVPGKGCEKETKVCFGADCNIERIPGPHRVSAPKRNHAPGHGERVMAYWNLHKGQWSLKSLATGRVIARVPQVTLTGATFRVSEAGRQRVLREGVKNVHAGVVGVVGEGPRDGNTVAVRYNPRTGPHFTDRDSGRALVGAQTVSLNPDRSVTAWRPSYHQ